MGYEYEAQNLYNTSVCNHDQLIIKLCNTHVSYSLDLATWYFYSYNLPVDYIN